MRGDHQPSKGAADDVFARIGAFAENHGRCPSLPVAERGRDGDDG